jgi:hypothetical protein
LIHLEVRWTKDDPIQIQILFDPAAVFPAHRAHDQSGQSTLDLSCGKFFPDLALVMP